MTMTAGVTQPRIAKGIRHEKSKAGGRFHCEELMESPVTAGTSTAADRRYEKLNMFSNVSSGPKNGIF